MAGREEGCQNIQGPAGPAGSYSDPTTLSLVWLHNARREGRVQGHEGLCHPRTRNALGWIHSRLGKVCAKVGLCKEQNGSSRRSQAGGYDTKQEGRSYASLSVPVTTKVLLMMPPKGVLASSGPLWKTVSSPRTAQPFQPLESLPLAFLGDNSTGG